MGFIMLVSYLNIMYVNHTPCYGLKVRLMRSTWDSQFGETSNAKTRS